MADTLEATFAEVQAEANEEATPTESAPAEALGETPAPEAEAAPEHVEAEAEQPAVDAEETPLHTVKVRGQETQVEYSELIDGYQRQADYTKAKQELAAQRAQIESAATLWEHLQEDPVSTMAALQEHYESVLTEAEVDDPLEARLQAVEQREELARQQAVEAEIAAEMDRLSEVHGDFIRDDLLEFAIEQEIPNLEAALIYKKQLDERQKAEAARLQAKKAAPPTANRSVAAGSSAPPPVPVDSFESALSSAISDLGMASIMDAIND